MGAYYGIGLMKGANSLSSCARVGTRLAWRAHISRYTSRMVRRAMGENSGRRLMMVSASLLGTRRETAFKHEQCRRG